MGNCGWLSLASSITGDLSKVAPGKELRRETARSILALSAAGGITGRCSRIMRTAPNIGNRRPGKERRKGWLGAKQS